MNNIVFHVYGSGNTFVEKFKQFIKQYNFDNIVQNHGLISLETIALEIKSIHLGIIPNKKTVFTEINIPMRIFEYLNLKRPIIVPETKGIKDYFNSNSIYFFESGNYESLEKAILQAYNDIKSESYQILNEGLKIYNNFCWKKERQKLEKILI